MPGVETGTYGPVEDLARNRVNLNKVMDVGAVTAGVRSYVAVAGGIAVEPRTGPTC
jgi:allophanate hydrolase subunit 2